MDERLPNMQPLVGIEGTRIVIGIAIGLLIGVVIVSLYHVSAVYFTVVFGGLCLLSLGAFFPECSAAVLYTGMTLWSLAPQLDVFSGYRIPVTIGWVALSYATHALIIDRQKMSMIWTKLDSALLLFCTFAATSLMW